MGWKLKTVKISVLPKLIYNLIQSQPKISARFFFIEIDKLILKFIWKCRGPEIVVTTLKRNTARE